MSSRNIEGDLFFSVDFIYILLQEYFNDKFFVSKNILKKHEFEEQKLF